MLLVLTFIAVNTKSNNIKTSLSNLCRLLCKSRGANQYASIIQSLTRLGQVSVAIHVYDQESSEKRIASINFGSIITGNIDPDSTNIDISLNSYFLDQYLGKLSTSIHLGTRSKLNSDVAKALHRFLSTHKKFEYPFNLQTSLSNLCRLLCKSRGANQYASIIQSLTRLGQVSVAIHVYDQESSEKRISSINLCFLN